jgi:hypothetical protein
MLKIFPQVNKTLENIDLAIRSNLHNVNSSIHQQFCIITARSVWLSKYLKENIW